MQHRTAIVTAASVAVVILAATAAIAANLGILTSATNTGQVGSLTVASSTSAPAGSFQAPPAQVLAVTDDETGAASTTPDPTSPGDLTAYAVGDAGVVTLAQDGSILTITDISTNDGWEAAAFREGIIVDIGFVSAQGQVLRFAAEVDPTGTIQTLVEDLSPTVRGERRGDDDEYEHEGREHEREDDDD